MQAQAILQNARLIVVQIDARLYLITELRDSSCLQQIGAGIPRIASKAATRGDARQDSQSNLHALAHYLCCQPIGVLHQFYLLHDYVQSAGKQLNGLHGRQHHLLQSFLSLLQSFRLIACGAL